jgi:DNA-binding transcriptional regulator YiaG
MDCRKVRHKHNLKQRELADMIGVHPMTVYRWECGLLLPNTFQNRLLDHLYSAPADSVTPGLFPWIVKTKKDS